MRTLLTMLGIVIGVGAVIVMVAVGQGAQQSIANQINAFGTNLIIDHAGREQRRRRESGRAGVQPPHGATTRRSSSAKGRSSPACRRSS